MFHQAHGPAYVIAAAPRYASAHPSARRRRAILEGMNPRLQPSRLAPPRRTLQGVVGLWARCHHRQHCGCQRSSRRCPLAVAAGSGLIRPRRSNFPPRSRPCPKRQADPNTSSQAENARSTHTGGVRHHRVVEFVPHMLIRVRRDRALAEPQPFRLAIRALMRLSRPYSYRSAARAWLRSWRFSTFTLSRRTRIWPDLVFEDRRFYRKICR